MDNLSEQIIKYVDENDYVTFAKLQNYIQEFTETKGDWSLEKEENLILWNGISEELADCLVSLIDKEIGEEENVLSLQDELADGFLKRKV